MDQTSIVATGSTWGTHILADATGLCYFWVIFCPWSPINGRTMLADLINAATGMNIDEGGTTKIARRIINLIRAYNVRGGMGRKHDTLPDKLFERPPISSYHRLDRNLFDKWLDRFYELRGWNREGIPTKKTLEESGLDYVEQELERRGILLE